jgi:hypothetical protein
MCAHTQVPLAVSVPKGYSPMNQIIFVEKNPIDPNPTKIIHGSFKSNKP